jgi:hypothetical protein
MLELDHFTVESQVHDHRLPPSSCKAVKKASLCVGTTYLSDLIDGAGQD